MNDNELKFIVNKFYDLKKATVLKILENGWDNTNILLEVDNEKYVFRIYNNATTDEVLEELELIKLLNKFQFPTYKIIRTFDNKLYIQYKNKVCILYKYIEGRCLQDFILKKEIIQLVNSLHVITFGYNIKAKRNKFKNVERNFLQIIKNNSILADKLYDLVIIVKDWMENEAQFISSNEQNLRKGWVHHDLNPDNFIYNSDNTLSIIDFDECLYGPVIIDIVSLFHYWCLSEDGSYFSIDLAREIVNEYNEITPLSRKELEMLPYYMLQFQLQDTILYLIREYEEGNVLVNLEESYAYRGLRLLFGLFKENKLEF